MGDGVLVYFGYPEAHEDDAERAVRAGLAVIDASAGSLGQSG
jgi:class 3 adenylate cyclase